MPSNYCKTLRYSCLKFLCDQHVLRRVLQCCFWMLQSHKSLGNHIRLPAAAGLHHLLLKVGAHVSSSLWDPSGSIPCLFPLYLTPSTPQWESFCEIWRNKAISYSYWCWSGHCHQGTAKIQCWSHMDQPLGHKKLQRSLKASAQMSRAGVSW